jgi:hypothetical protein
MITGYKLLQRAERRYGSAGTKRQILSTRMHEQQEVDGNG